jgi:hypothetical protein
VDGWRAGQGTRVDGGSDCIDNWKFARAALRAAPGTVSGCSARARARASEELRLHFCSSLDVQDCGDSSRSPLALYPGLNSRDGSRRYFCAGEFDADRRC